ncbi:hypothetical protein KC354_g64 [Hortaea werneckii]|nr:hypothetical protein KC354_g64 [Hortaea werneckii]
MSLAGRWEVRWRLVDVLWKGLPVAATCWSATSNPFIFAPQLSARFLACPASFLASLARFEYAVYGPGNMVSMKHVAFGQRLDHGEDEGVTDDFQPCRGALWLRGVVDLCPAHDPFAEGLHAGDFFGWAGEDADEVAGVCGRGGAEDGAGDEGGAGGVDGLCELVCGVGVNG